MSISSNLLFPVEYNSREIFTCFSAVFKKLLSLFCSEGYLGQKFPLFLYLDLNYAQNDEILLTKNNHLDISICPALLNSQPLSKVLHKTKKFYSEQVSFVYRFVWLATLLHGYLSCSTFSPFDAPLRKILKSFKTSFKLKLSRLQVYSRKESTLLILSILNDFL